MGPREIRILLASLRRRWWLIAAGGLIALGVTWWQGRGAVPLYTAEVLLEQRAETPLVGGGIGRATMDFGAQVELIRSRSVAAAVLDSLGLQLQILPPRPTRIGPIGRVEVGAEAHPGPYMLARDGSSVVLLRTVQQENRAPVAGDTLARAGLDEWITGPDFRMRLADPGILDRGPLRFFLMNRQVAIEVLRRSIGVEIGRSPSLIRIQYRSTDPILAAAVVNAAAAAFQDQRAEWARQDAARRRDVIAQQLVQLADSLERAQQLVVDYQRSTGLDPGLEGGRLSSMVLDGEAELRTLRFQQSLLESLIAGMRSEQAQDESVHRILSLGAELVPAGPALHARLQDLEIERSRLTASRFGRTEGDPQVEVLDSLIASTRGQILMAVEQGLDHMRVRLAAAEERLVGLRSELGTTPGRTAELARLRQKADAVQGVVDNLVDRYFEAQVAEAAEGGGVAVVDPAIVPLWPDRSQRRIKYLIALAVGMMVGGFGALSAMFFDKSVQRAADVQLATGLPLLGMVPLMPTARRDPMAAAIGKEAFRSLRTNLRFGESEDPRVVSLTSATPREGKTTVAVNLATTLAEQGSDDVLLIDADLRRPVVHQVFEIGRSPGLTDMLQKTARVEGFYRSPAHPNLYVLPCGSPVRNPAHLLGSPAFGELLAELRKHFAYIVIDTPPVLAVTDGMIVTQVVDGTIMVVRANHTDRDAVTNAMTQLRHVNASLLGVILNAVDVRSSEGRSYYRYHQDYLTSDEDGSGKAGRRLLSAS